MKKRIIFLLQIKNYISKNEEFISKIFERFLVFLFFFIALIFLSNNIFTHTLTGTSYDGRLMFHLLDDSMINFKISYNFWDKGFPYYNLDDSVSANTSLFWPILTSFIFFFFEKNESVIILYLLSGFLFSLIALLFFIYEKNKFKSFLKCVFLLLTPMTMEYSTSGWEHIPQTLLVTLSFLIIFENSKKKLQIPNKSLIILSFAFLLRIDTAPLIFVVFIFWLSINFKKIFFKDLLKNIITVLACISILLFYLILMNYFYNDFFPNTYYLKSLPIKESILLGLKYFLNPITSNYWFFVFLIIFINYKKLNFFQKFVTISILFQFIYIIWAGGDIFYNSRFLILIIPILIFIFIDLVYEYLSNIKFKFINKKIFIISMSLIFIFLQYLNPYNLKTFFLNAAIKNPSNIKLSSQETQMILASHILSKLEKKDGSIGLHWAGIGYHLGDFNIVDFLGKADDYIAKTKPKNNSIGHNKWDYEYSFKKYNIAAVPMYNYYFNQPTGQLKKNYNDFWIDLLNYLIKINKNYTFLNAQELGIDEKINMGLWVRNDLVNKIKKN